MTFKLNLFAASQEETFSNSRFKIVSVLDVKEVGIQIVIQLQERKLYYFENKDKYELVSVLLTT